MPSISTYFLFAVLTATALGVTGTAILYGNAVRLASFARVLRLPADVAHWTALAANISTAFHAAFFNESSRSYGSQTANAMALALGVAPTARARDAALSALTADIMARAVHQTGGDIGLHLLIFLRLFPRPLFSLFLLFLVPFFSLFFVFVRLLHLLLPPPPSSSLLSSSSPLPSPALFLILLPLLLLTLLSSSVGRGRAEPGVLQGARKGSELVFLVSWCFALVL